MAGSIEERGKNKYRLVVSAGFGIDGKRKKYTKTITASGPRAAEKELAKFVAEVESNRFLEPSKFTMAEFIDRWIRNYVEPNLSYNTILCYKKNIKKIIYALGHLKLDKIKPIHINEFYQNLREDGIRMDGKPGKLSPKSILQVHLTLSSIFQIAVKWKLISENPIRNVEKPKLPHKETSYYDEEQLTKLFDCLQKEPYRYRVIVYLALATGLRRGEIMGLEWQDIDFEKGTLEVNKSSQYELGKGVVLKEPKTKNAKRIISIPNSVLQMLKEFKNYQLQKRLKCGEFWQSSGRVFTNWNGKPLNPDKVSMWFAKFIRKNELPHMTFHGLRHTSISLLITKGVHAKAISSRAGHASISTTLDIYGHVFKQVDQESAEKLDEIFIQKDNKNREKESC